MKLVKSILFITVLLVLLGSAVAVVYSKYQQRQLFMAIQQKEKELDDYEVEWGRLQLELTMLTEENRVAIEARQKLKLVLPLREQIIYVKP